MVEEWSYVTKSWLLTDESGIFILKFLESIELLRKPNNYKSNKQRKPNKNKPNKQRKTNQTKKEKQTKTNQTNKLTKKNILNADDTIFSTTFYC